MLYRLILLLVMGLPSASANTFNVTSLADTSSGSCAAACTLRDAIIAANATPAADVIRFVIPGDGPLRIIVTSNLPTITQPVTIDGYSQPGALENTLPGDASNAVIRIWLDAANNLAEPSIGLAVCGSNVFIRGLAITGFRTHTLAYGTTDTGSACAGTAGGDVTGNFLGFNPLGRQGGQAIPSTVVDGRGGATLRVGGSALSERNVIATGSSYAMELSGNATVQIDGNLIGTGPDGNQSAMAPSNGILIAPTAAASIGTQQANLIANLTTGIVVLAGSSGINAASNRFLNVSLPIDLGGDGVTGNDSDDADTGPNNLQNFPVLSLARRGADSLLVQGTLDRPAGSSALVYSITFYASASCGPTGHGPADRLLGSQLITLANGNNQTFSISLNAIEPLGVGTAIVAVATDSADNSSEASSCLAVTDSPAALVVTNTANSGAGSLADAVAQANANADANVIAFNIPGAGPHTISPSPGLRIETPMLIDGYTQAGATANTLARGATNAQIRIEIDASNISGSLSAFFVTAPLTLRGVAIKELPTNAKGVSWASSSAAGSRVQGCFIGTDASGNVTGAPAGDGVIMGTRGQIGGTLADHRNLFGGLSNAVSLFLGGPSDSVVEGNLFGTTPDGLGARANVCALAVSAASGTLTGVRLGGFLPEEQNVVANSTGSCGGVSTSQTTGSMVGATIGNASLSNSALGIDLGSDGISLNDANDADSGPNGLQNFPELFLAQPVAGLGLRVSGQLDIPTFSVGTRYRLAFYESVACDPSGFGEGTIYLGSADVALSDLPTTSLLIERFVVDLPVNTAPGRAITATATAADGSTSEFSRCTLVASADTVMKNGFE